MELPASSADIPNPSSFVVKSFSVFTMDWQKKDLTLNVKDSIRISFIFIRQI